MADELPVHEILCDAMEYLVKLGSNLRTRSENLKEKRISKSKLTNAHAVQKAANKVLLICELSKKSLENVESGVKKVLQVIGTAQSAERDGGNNIELPKSSPSKHKYNFIEVGKQTIKIKKRIPLKHYQSVRVNAKKMSLSMIEKYPVYHDCKLFRLRVKYKKDTTSPQKSCDDTLPQKERADSSDSKIKSKDKSHKEEKYNKEKPRKSFESSEKESKFSPSKSKSLSFKKHRKSIISSDSEADQNKSKDTETSIEKTNKEDKSVLNESLSSDTKSKSNNVEEKSCDILDISDNGDSLDLKSKKKKKLIIQDTSESENDVGEKNNVDELSEGHKSDKRISGTPKKDSTSRRCSTPKSNEVEIDSQSTTKSRSRRESKVLDKDVKDSFECDEKNNRSITTNDACNVSEQYDIVTIDLDGSNNGCTSPLDEGFRGFDMKTLSELQNDGKPDTPSIDNTNNGSSDSKKVKPAIKCVNLSKLLKPTILQKLSVKNIKQANDKDSTNKNNQKEERERQDNEEYWKIKRKEVSNFKPKKFSIQVTRLVTYTDTFLKTHDIKKITSKGTVLKELDSENVNKLDASISELNKVKKILLCDSESDQNASDKENPVNKNGETSKNSVQSEENGRELTSNREHTSDLLFAESENEDIEITPRKAKSALLDDSSVENTPISKPNDNEDTDGGKPQSMREKIKESMHAKKMLLTYSSSDTEDEQLNNVFKEIKDSLLRENSSDENGINEGNKSQSKRTSKSSISSVKKMGRTKAKPTSSSSQNSDTQDTSDKEIEGLTNVKSLNKTRQRCDSPTDSQGSSTKTRDRSKKMPTAAPIEEDALEAYTSSNPSENEDEVEEELPKISMSGLNGDGEDHLAKDDLLDDSDSSNTPNEKEKSPDETKKEGESEEEILKSKRRKANAISSDSEIGSSRKKVDISDFEDSEGSLEAKKKNKKSKRKKSSESEGSDENSSNEGKKKRRRIKQVDSEGSGSDSENEGRNKHGRKNIRKVMGKDQLEEATKKAARQEKERIARIAERQKVYNNLQFDESGKPDEVVLEKVVLDFDPETKEPLIQVDRGLVKKLKPHQANGIKFMWDACFESVKRIKKDKGSGCILAHCMGLGKTLQVISLTHTLLIHSDLTRVNRVLVVCPLSTVLNWVNEFKIWLKHAVSDYEIDVYELSRYKQNSERAYQMSQWFEGGGVCVLGYEMFRNLSADNSKKYRKKMLKSFQESLVDPGPDMVVCDEGHLLKNEKTSLSQSMNRVKTLRRIVLTGTPLQNNLKEYYCMVQFVKPNLLGKYNEYLNRFVNPITNGQYTDSTEYDIKVMKRRSHVLHKMLDGAVQRRDYGVLAPFLPPKHEYVLFITLTEVQVKLYQFYLDNYSRRPMPGKSSGFLFPDFQSLQRIWTHPLVLKYNSERYEIMQQKKRDREEEDSEGSLADFIDDDSSPEETSTEESSDDMSDVSDDSRKKSKKKKASKKGKGKDSKASTRRGTRANPVVALEEEDKNISEVEEIKNDNPTEWWIKLVADDELDDLKNSHKLLLLFDILRQCEAIGDKLLVFSQSLYSLDLIEHFLGRVDEATQEGRIDDKLAGHVGSWSPGVDYFRLDGSTSCENRSIWCKNFNREDNPRARLFLISTRAGGLGINLVAANRVVIFDVSWNPSHDVQSIFRVYRFGQKKPCYVYRFLAMGTMEEKIYERQVTKQAISKRVIDEQQIDRHYAENDLAELYTFQPSPPSPRAIPALPKDRLFAEMLKDHEAQIYKYHEHDSLLENKEEETLSEEERKAAWEDFENEKNKPPPAPFVSPWNMHNGMAPGLLVAQQQQLAYAALASMLRKDMPNINEQQIRDMLPMICNSNPAMFGGYDYGLMQKMNDIYKYSQPGMMNPSMMNPMNATGSMGGTSGLQYSPPWQRQQQQQQQMRLQQMLQQQNPMGAKFYAGGLGSRDPVAMALQQQRAREIMLGERSRPRGRPPGTTARPSPTNANDVVNLDSD